MLSEATRREALKRILLISTAGCVASLGGSEIILSSAAKAKPQNYTIKVGYFGFETIQTTGVNEEYLTLPAPVFLQDALRQIKDKHVVFATMLPIMAISIDGIPANGNPQLSNNSEIDFIPTFAGG